MKQWDVKSNISQPIVPQALGGLGITTSGSVLALLGRIVGDVHRLETYRTIIGDHRVSKEMLIVAFGEIKALHGSARFLTGFGSVQHDLGQFDQMTDFPDGGDLLIESGGLVMGPQGIGNRCDVTVDLGQRRIDGLSGAPYGQSLLHH